MRAKSKLEARAQRSERSGFARALVHYRRCESSMLALVASASLAHKVKRTIEKHSGIDLSNVYKITVQRAIFTAQHVRVRRFGKRAKHAPYARTFKMAPAIRSFLERSIDDCKQGIWWPPCSSSCEQARGIPGLPRLSSRACCTCLHGWGTSRDAMLANVYRLPTGARVARLIPRAACRPRRYSPRSDHVRSRIKCRAAK